jgi:hypothetical protein
MIQHGCVWARSGSLPSSKVSNPSHELPIVGIRAVNYTWVEADLDDPTGMMVKPMAAFRVEIRREGDVEWTEIPVIAGEGQPR